MNVGIIGLGRMGSAIAERLLVAGHSVTGFDPDQVTRNVIKNLGGSAVDTLAAMAIQERIIWLMVPAGNVTDEVINALLPHLKVGDIIIDGGNSDYRDTVRRASQLEQRGIFLVDCGTSGGIHGREHGFCLMVGGSREVYDTIYPLLQSIAAPGGCGYMGPVGTGHYVKMIHNGIEYALLQAYAEGFQLIKEGTFKDNNLDLETITRVWNNGSVIRSFILELAHDIFKEDKKLETIAGEVAHTGMGLWTVQEAHQHKIPVPTIEDALKVRIESQKSGGNFATKVVAMLRNKFGGHAVKKDKGVQ